MANAVLPHLNGNLLCGIDVETTGLDPELHEIYEIAIIPMTQNFEYDVNRHWLDLKIRPNSISNIAWTGVDKVKNASRIKDAIDNGVDSDTAQSILQRYFEDLNLGRCRIAPVGHNYSFDSRFLRSWLGNLNYEDKFADWEIRDTMVIARFVNDLLAYRGEPHAYAKVNLTYLATTLKISHDYGRAHTAVADAATTISVFREEIKAMNRIMLQ